MRANSANAPGEFASFGELLKFLRRRAGLTQRELSIQVGYSDSLISRMEQNERLPDAATLRARFFPALDIEHDPLMAARLLELAAQARAQSPPPADGYPTGTLTFLFTDIEASTQLRQEQPQAYSTALDQHHTLLRAAIEANAGRIFKLIGDAVCAAFATAPDALRAARDAQLALLAEDWGAVPLRVRMALHAGAAELRDGDYWGFTLARVARLLPAGHGGQVLLSQATADLLADETPDGCALRDLGEHRLKDLVRAECIYQLAAPGLPEAFPPLKTLDAHRHNLPVQLTSFVGREREMAEAARLLGAARLLTLVGPGGSGKTRLALQASAEVVEQYSHGAWFVELAPLADPTLVPQAAATALGVREQPGRPILAALQDFLRAKQLLLVLDNCEHLVEAAARLADDLLHAAPGLRILATSREGLGIAGETTYRVPVLGLPDVTRLPDVERLTQYDAVRLFIERAAAVQSDFAVTNANAPAVAQICHRLDGIPLAIELAAARVRVLAVEQIAARLDDRFKLLTGGSRTALPRQQTLRATIDWSHDLLSANERVLFRRLAAFAGGWTLEAAEKVCSGDGLAAAGVLDLLDSLVNRSLVSVEAGAGEARYQMLETVRQYGEERLAQAGEAEAVRARHFDFYLHLAETGEPFFRRREQLEWLARLTTEHDNLRAALAWGLERNAQAAITLAANVATFWYLYDFWTEGHTWLTRSLEATADQPPDAARVRATFWLAVYTGIIHSWREAQPGLEAALSLADALGDDWTAIMALSIKAWWHRGWFSPDLAVQVASEAVARSERLADIWLQAMAMSALASALQSSGKLAASQTIGERALALATQTGDRWLQLEALTSMGDVARVHGDYVRARTWTQDYLRLTQEFGSPSLIGQAQGGSATLACRLGDFDSARMHIVAALALSRDSGVTLHIQWHLLWLGYIASLQGDCATTEACHAEAAQLAESPNISGVLPSSLHYRGLAAYHCGDLARSAALLTQGAGCARGQNNVPELRMILHGLALTCYAFNDHDGARRALAEGLDLAREANDLRALARLGQVAGRLALADGDPGRAAESFRESLHLRLKMGAKRGVAESLEGLGDLAARQSDGERAARLLGAAEALRELIGAPIPPPERAEYDQALSAARHLLGGEAFARLWADGRALSWEQAAQYALEG